MKNIIGLIFIVFVLASCGEEAEPVVMAKDTRPTVAVKLSQTGESEGKENFRVSGKIQAENNVKVSPKIMGTLTNITLNVGDRVQSGQVLAKIENDNIDIKIAQVDAGIAEARVSLANVVKNLGRIQNLFSKGSATQKELDDITTQKDVINAKIKKAEEMKRELNTVIPYSTITAPMSGIVIEKYASSGDLASPGVPLFNIESSSNFQAEAMIPEHMITKVKKGDKVKVILKSNNQELDGTIAEKSKSSFNTGGQYLIKINLSKKSLKGLELFTGMYLNILIPQKGGEKVSKKTMVNESAIVHKGQLTGLYTVSEQNTAILRWVRLGRSSAGQVEVLSGLSKGESYISEHEGRLMNGVKVTTK